MGDVFTRELGGWIVPTIFFHVQNYTSNKPYKKHIDTVHLLENALLRCILYTCMYTILAGRLAGRFFVRDSKCCIVDNWTCFSSLKMFHLSSKKHHKVKCPQGTEVRPVAYSTALRITMTWMTENLHQLFTRQRCTPLISMICRNDTCKIYIGY